MTKLLGLGARKPVFGVSDNVRTQNQPVQLQTLARKEKFACVKGVKIELIRLRGCTG